jgi:hypothetical protein
VERVTAVAAERHADTHAASAANTVSTTDTVSAHDIGILPCRRRRILAGSAARLRVGARPGGNRSPETPAAAVRVRRREGELTGSARADGLGRKKKDRAIVTAVAVLAMGRDLWKKMRPPRIYFMYIKSLATQF